MKTHMKIKGLPDGHQVIIHLTADDLEDLQRCQSLPSRVDEELDIGWLDQEDEVEE
jgi:hypothetical protein